MKTKLLIILTFSCVGLVLANSNSTTNVIFPNLPSLPNFPKLPSLPQLPRLKKNLIIPNLFLPYSKDDGNSEIKERLQTVMKVFNNFADFYSEFPLKTIYASMMITKAFTTDLYKLSDNIKNFDISKLPEKVQNKVKEYVDEITSLIPIFVNSIITIFNELPSINSFDALFKLFTQEIKNCFTSVFKLCYNLFKLGIPFKSFLPNTFSAIFEFVSAIYSDIISIIKDPSLLSFLVKFHVSALFRPVFLLSFFM